MYLEKWIRSSRCNLQGNCVELARHADGVAVRDSKGEAGPLTFDHLGWSTFIDHLSAGVLNKSN